MAAIDMLDRSRNSQTALDIFIERQVYRKKWYPSFHAAEYHIWLKELGLNETYLIISGVVSDE